MNPNNNSCSDSSIIGKIKRIKLRKVWPHEAHNFTTWMQDNLDIINDLLEINITNAEREKSVGSFNVDLVAEDENGNPVIIENQLEKSNHDHLGKVITYLTAIQAKTAIWIVSDPRPEHANAVMWLNESTSASFYLLKIEAIQIGESDPAPLLTLIAGPSEVTREAGIQKKEIAERNILRKKFWSSLLEKAKEKTKLHALISPSWDNWVGTSSSLGGLGCYNYTVLRHGATIELYLDGGNGSAERNEAAFSYLEEHKDTIENDFQNPLEWQLLEGKRACRIRYDIPGTGYRDDEAKWPELHDKMIDAMIRLENACRPHIKSFLNRK